MCMRLKESSNVRKFLEDDENSMMCPGKKDHVNQVQKRYLAAPLKEIHKKYCEQYSSKMSFKTFQRAKPFWIIKPKLSNRNTCACCKHENFQFLLDALHNIGLLSTNRSADILNSICCNSQNLSCIYRTCSNCQTKKAFSYDENILSNDVTYFQFSRVTEKETSTEKKKQLFLLKKLP